jgi:hypothetical protein
MAGPHWHISRFCSMLSVCARFLKHEDALADGSGTKLTSDGKFVPSNLSRANVRLCYMMLHVCKFCPYHNLFGHAPVQRLNTLRQDEIRFDSWLRSTVQSMIAQYKSPGGNRCGTLRDILEHMTWN